MSVLDAIQISTCIPIIFKPIKYMWNKVLGVGLRLFRISVFYAIHSTHKAKHQIGEIITIIAHFSWIAGDPSIQGTAI